MKQKRVMVINTQVTAAPYQYFIDEITRLALLRKSSYVCFANAHMLTEVYQNPAFERIVNGADLVAPDGRPVSLLMNYRYKLSQVRVCGMDLFPNILEAAKANEISVYFYGSTPEVLATMEAKIRRELPGLTVAGSYSPPFRPLTLEEDQDVVDRINNSGAHLVFVSLGCPKQERWMYSNYGKIHACMLGLGQAFLTYTGVEKRLPKWARDYSLEWAYRLCLEPKRLWKRYLLGNTLFLWLAMQSLAKRTEGEEHVYS